MAAKVLSKALKVALVQLPVTADKAKNLATISSRVAEAASNGAKLVVLPECFNSPYAVTAFPQYAEQIPQGETTQLLSKLAAEKNIFLVGGSIPEIDESSGTKKYFNTNITFSPSGELISTHRKVHLFDIDVPGKIKFKESDILSPGEKATDFQLEGYGRVGLGICYDIRFPELAAVSTRATKDKPLPAFAMIYPGAFNLTTGPLHWILLARARAVDNQVYVLVCSPSRDMSASYHAFGHSAVIDPWGNVIAEAGHGDEIIYAELDNEKLASIHESIPVSTQRRPDVYRLPEDI